MRPSGVSGKSWSEILILDPVYKIDHEYGWNLLAAAKMHRSDELGMPNSLVIVSVTGLFLLWALGVLPWLKWPEAWLVALLLSAASSDVPERFITGRPFTVTAAGLIGILFLWQKNGTAPPRKMDAGLDDLASFAESYPYPAFQWHLSIYMGSAHHAAFFWRNNFAGASVFSAAGWWAWSWGSFC